MTLSFNHWASQTSSNTMLNQVTGKQVNLSENQFALLTCLIEEISQEIDFNELASIGWPTARITDDELKSTLDELVSRFEGDISLTYTQSGVIPDLVIKAQTSGNDHSEQHESRASSERLASEASSNQGAYDHIDLKTILAAIFIVAITAGILIFSN